MRKQYTLAGFSRLKFHQNKFCTEISQGPGNGIGQGYVIRGPFPKKHGFSRWDAQCSLLALYNLCYTNLQDESWQMHYGWRKATRPRAGHFISLGPCFLHCGLLGPLVQGPLPQLTFQDRESWLYCPALAVAAPAWSPPSDLRAQHSNTGWLLHSMLMDGSNYLADLDNSFPKSTAQLNVQP